MISGASAWMAISASTALQAIHAQALGPLGAILAVAAVLSTALVTRRLLYNEVRAVLWPGSNTAARFTEHATGTAPTASGCPFARVPESLGLPLVGHLPAFMRDKEAWMSRMLHRLGPVYNVSLGQMYGTAVARQSTFRQVLESPAFNIDSHPRLLDLMGEEQMLMGTDGQVHADVRSFLTAPFTPETVGGYIPAIQTIAATEAQRMADLSAQDTPVKVLDHFKRVTFEVITNAVMQLGLSAKEVSALSREYETLLSGSGVLLTIDLPGFQWHRAMQAKRAIAARCLPIIQRARQELQDGTVTEETATLLHRLILLQDHPASHGVMTDQAQLNTLIGLLFAGHDTTNYSLTMLWWHLAQHPDWVHRLRREQEAVVARHGEELSPAAVGAMRELDAAVRETLRVKPVALMVVRTANRDVEIDRVRFKKGARIMVQLGALHAADPALVEGSQDGSTDPAHPPHMDFEAGWQPERWLQPSTRPAAFYPWGHGAHICLGATLAYTEMKVVSAELLRHWDVEVVDSSTTFTTDNLFPMPTHGLPAIVRRRGGGQREHPPQEVATGSPDGPVSRR